MSGKSITTANWISRLPSQLACCLLAICLVTSQLNPCDTVIGIAQGDSSVFIVLALGIGFLVGLDGLVSPSEQDRVTRTAVALGALCAVFGLWLCVCSMLQVGVGNARFAFNGCWHWIAELILLMSIARLASRVRTRHTLLSLMIAIAVGVVVYSLYQYYVSMPRDRAAFFANKDSALSELNIVAGSSQAILYLMRLESTEPIGPFALTNSMAGFLASWLVLLLLATIGSAAVSLKPSSGNAPAGSRLAANKKDWIANVLLACIAFGCFFILVLTKSRTAWLATLIGAFAGAVAYAPIRGKVLQVLIQYYKAALATGALGLLLVGGVIYRDSTVVWEAGKSLTYRFDYWRGAAKLIAERPWTGHGANTFQSNYNRVKVLTASESPADPHNFLLETGYVGGIPLLVVLAIMLVVVFLHLCTLIRNSGREASQRGVQPEYYGPGAILCGMILALVGQFAFHFFSSSDDLLITIGLFCGAVVAAFWILQWLRVWDSIADLEVLCLSASGVMLVHLLASGGWMLPGVMNTFCVLIGIGISGSASSDISVGKNVQSACRWLAVGLVLLVAWLATTSMLLPVMNALEKSHAIAIGEYQNRDARDWESLMQVDTMGTELPRLTAEHAMQVLMQGRNRLSATEEAKWNQTLELSVSTYLNRDPINWIALTDCGRWNAILADAFPEPIQPKVPLEKNEDLATRRTVASGYFVRAADNYPSSIPAQLQAAIALVWAGDRERAKVYMDRVTEIDQTTPHSDRKLAASVVYFPYSLEATGEPLPDKARIREEPGNARGEPVMVWLRNTVP